MSEASPRAARRRRWRNRVLGGIVVYLTLFVAVRLAGTSGPVVHQDLDWRVTQAVFSTVGTQVDGMAWRDSPDSDGLILMTHSIGPISLQLWETVLNLEAYYDLPDPMIHAIDLASGRVIESTETEWGAWSSEAETSSAGVGIEIKTADGICRLQCGANRPGDPVYFVVDELESGERIIQDELGDFAWMRSNEELQEAQRAVLHYGDSGQWRELAEVRFAEGEDDDRWDFKEEKLGLEVGLLMPIDERIADDGVTEILTAYRTQHDCHVLHFRLSEDLELVSESSVAASRLPYEREVVQVDGQAVEGGFAIAMAELVLDPTAHSATVNLSLESPRHERREHVIPVHLAKHHRVDPGTHDPLDEVELRLVSRPDQDGDGVDDWLALIRVDGSAVFAASVWHSDRASFAIVAEFSGATGQLLPRKHER